MPKAQASRGHDQLKSSVGTKGEQRVCRGELRKFHFVAISKKKCVEPPVRYAIKQCSQYCSLIRYVPRMIRCTALMPKVPVSAKPDLY